jgi:DNA-binding beta-propeller fold protein YncE
MRNILAATTLAFAACLATSAQAQFIVSGNDEKVTFNDAGKLAINPPGKDTVSVIDISKRSEPQIVANLQLTNSIFGPPTNLAVTPDQTLALVANSLNGVQEDGKWKFVPDDEVYVIDLAAKPIAVIDTLRVGKQPSGMAINKAGTLALVTNRADNTVSVLTISGKEVKVAGTVALAAAGTPNQQPSAVAITPDGKHALVAKAPANKVALLDIDGSNVTYTGYDMTTGIFPYNVLITPDGKLGLVNNNGASGASDGQVDTVAVIDLTLTPPRVVDQVAVGDGPEGMAMSPTGEYAVSVLLNGVGNVPKTAFYHHDHSMISLLKIEGGKVRKVSETEVGGLTEGAAFSPDGEYLYAGNFNDQDVTILRLAKDKLVPIGTLKLPGHPASMSGTEPF